MRCASERSLFSRQRSLATASSALPDQCGGSQAVELDCPECMSILNVLATEKPWLRS
jgi:hypothetical protein